MSVASKRARIGGVAAAWLAACGSEGSSGEGRLSGESGDDGIVSISASADGSTTAADDGVDGDTMKLDAPPGTAGMNDGGDCMGGMGTEGEYEFSYIWIANSPEGTVSKINTFTGVEEGRYRTGANNPDPSRTSVNQFGDVAVANRNGSIVKIAAQEESCVDGNGNGTIETSSGAADILAWGADECVLWSIDLPATGVLGPRPVAWEPVESNCGTVQPRVWVGHGEGTGQDVGIFYRLDGTTGQVLDTVEVEAWDYGTSPRPYGGAVTADGDFWVTGYYGPAVRIDSETLAVEYIAPPDELGFYGMALDADGTMWVGSCEGAIWHLDAAKQWIKVADIDGRARGVQVDREGRAWFAGNDPCRLLMVDTATNTLVQDAIPLQDCGMPVGVSIDVEGFVWVVDRDASRAYKVDPDTFATVLVVEGLVEPYTYSDMTGGGLSLVANPPAG